MDKQTPPTKSPLNEVRLFRPLADIPAVLKHFEKDPPAVRLKVVRMCLTPYLVMVVMAGLGTWRVWLWLT